MAQAERTCSKRVASLRSSLQKSADKKTKEWFEKYMKNVIPYYGLKMGGIRTCVHDWAKSEKIDQLSGNQSLKLAVELLEQGMAEEKLAGILLLHEFIVPSSKVEWTVILDQLGKVYENEYIFDWNTSDWLSVKVLDALLKRNGKPCAQAISRWADSTNLWRRRAAGVAFAWLAKGGDKDNFVGFIDIVLDICARTVAFKERFAQTGTGWILRELALANQERVVQFVHEHAAEFTTEGIDYTTEKMNKALKTRLKALVHQQSGTEVGARKKVKRS